MDGYLGGVLRRTNKEWVVDNCRKLGPALGCVCLRFGEKFWERKKSVAPAGARKISARQTLKFKLFKPASSAFAAVGILPSPPSLRWCRAQAAGLKEREMDHWIWRDLLPLPAHRDHDKDLLAATSLCSSLFIATPALLPCRYERAINYSHIHTIFPCSRAESAENGGGGGHLQPELPAHFLPSIPLRRSFTQPGQGFLI